MQNEGGRLTVTPSVTVDIGPVRVELTPPDHAWQNESPGGERSRFPTRGRLRVLASVARSCAVDRAEGSSVSLYLRTDSLESDTPDGG